ncbi:MAG: hypothetical protein BMS9Abin37_0903 [Acidobacteriota bacterium]|nr:MAG: hypothetical protein BMS9Abin37_0903 [Acidobacteriota bacterium]
MFRPILLAGALLICFDARAEPLRVVTTSMAPFFYEENGEPRGIEYDILRYYANTEGRTLEVVWVDSFKDVLPALERGEAEIASAAITITETRKKRFGFSSSYFPSQLVLVQRATEATKDLASLSGARIGVLAGSTSLEALSGVDVEMVHAENTLELYQAVVDGKTEGAVTATARALLLLQDFEPLDISLHLGEKEEFGFATAKDSPLATALSEHIVKIKSSGIYFRLLETYLGPKAAAIVQAGSR